MPVEREKQAMITGCFLYHGKKYCFSCFEKGPMKQIPDVVFGKIISGRKIILSLKEVIGDKKCPVCRLPYYRPETEEAGERLYKKLRAQNETTN